MRFVLLVAAALVGGGKDARVDAAGGRGDCDGRIGDAVEIVLHFDGLYGQSVLFGSPKAGPQPFMTADAFDTWLGALVASPSMPYIREREDAQDFALACGARLSACVRSQAAWAVHNCVKLMVGHRAFSLGSAQYEERVRIFLMYIEKAAIEGAAGLPDHALDLAHYFMDTLLDMGLIGGRPDVPDHYSLGPLVPRGSRGDPRSSVKKIVLGVMFAARSVTWSRDAATALAAGRGWGVVGEAFCVFGDYADTLAARLARDRSSPFDLVGNRDAFEARAAPVRDEILSALPATCRALSLLMDLYLLGDAALAVQFIDASVGRDTSPYFRMGPATQTLREIRGRMSTASFEALYASPAYMFATLASRIYYNAGVYDERVVEEFERLPGGAGVHGRAMHLMSILFGENDDVSGEGSDYYWWLSLLFSLSCRVVVKVVRGRLFGEDDDDGDGDAESNDDVESSVVVVDDDDDDDDDWDADLFPGGRRPVWMGGVRSPEERAARRIWERGARRKLLARRGITGEGEARRVLDIGSSDDAAELRALRRAAFDRLVENDDVVTVEDGATTIFSFTPANPGWGAPPATVDELEAPPSIDVATLADRLVPRSAADARRAIREEAGRNEPQRFDQGRTDPRRYDRAAARIS